MKSMKSNNNEGIKRIAQLIVEEKHLSKFINACFFGGVILGLVIGVIGVFIILALEKL